MGSVTPVKILGILALVDQGEVDHKILALALADERSREIQSVADFQRLQPGVLDALVDCLKQYKVPEGKPENVLVHETPTSRDVAMQIVADMHKRWRKLQASESLWTCSPRLIWFSRISLRS
ncbi:hypothetical protein PsorP6_019636 [Peronosclerospora sorghi]|nr:hypothetical protein PsorP6_019636 [Peronosclerospora sorghi]